MKNKKIILPIVVFIIAVVATTTAYAKTHHRIRKSKPLSASQQDQEILSFGKQQANAQSGQGQNLQGSQDPAALTSANLAEAIDGVMVPASKVRRPFAVTVENHPAARPQSGLSQADIVYEALAEGGITRYLAIFQTQNVNMIGPVRSARTYFNDWAQEIGAVFAHVGGNSDALYYLHKGVPGVFDADQFYNGQFFWRLKTRRAPHNAYTSTALLNQLAAAHRLNMQKSYPDYQFKNDAAAAQPTATNISVQFSMPQFAVKWVYSSAVNGYRRFLAGKADIDAGDKKQITAKNVIVQIVKNWPVQSDTPLSISMGTRDLGAAYYFMDGTERKGTWRFVDGRTVFYDASGNEIQLNRGQTWIEIVPPEFEGALHW